MLTIIGDALNVAIRRRMEPLPHDKWAERFLPRNRREDQDRPERVNTLRDLRW